jgi:hypothetical protein
MSFDADAMVARIRAEAARRLLAAAITLQSAYRADLSVGNPAPHDNPAPPGQFPRLRTGGGRANVAVAPASVAEVVSRGEVAVGYRPGGMHLMYLGGRGWKWVTDTHARERDNLQRILGRA